MFLRKTPRKKDGKTHDYWSVVENKRVAGGRVVQRHVLYLGEINSSQAAVWRKAIEVLDDDAGHPRTLALFPEDRCAGIAPDTSVVQLRLSDMRLCRPRQWGACWLAGQLWRELELDRFWADRLPPSRKGTQWDQVLQVLVSYRLIAPGSEWKLGAARSRAPTAWRLVDIEMDKESSMFVYTLNRQKLRRIRRREGRYLLRTNLTENDPALLWQYYTQLVAVEEAFKNLKGDLAIRPVFHQEERRIEAHIFIAFLAYCLQITLQRRLHALAPGLTARSALEKFAAVQMIDVHLPTTDGRELLLTRYTQPEPELRLLIQQLRLQLPPQPSPRIATGSVTRHLL
jgi:hypothetical protein